MKFNLIFHVMLLLIGLSFTQLSRGSQNDFDVDKDTAGALADLGMTIIVGSYEAINESKKSESSNPDFARLSKTQQALVRNYKTQVTNITFGANLLHSSMNVAITGTQVVLSEGIVTAIPAAMLASGARYLNDQARNSLINNTVGKASNRLSEGIEQLNAEDAYRFNTLLSEKKFSNAADFLDNKTHALSSMKNALGNDENAKQLMDRVILEAVSKGSSDAIRLAGKAFDEIDNVDKKFTKEIKELTEFTDGFAQKFKDLDSSVSSLKESQDQAQLSINKLQKDQSATSIQVSMIQDILFDRESPAVKIKLLEEGTAKSYLSADQKSDLIEILKLQDKQQKVINKASEIISYASSINIILTNAGIANKDLGAAINYGNTAISAANQAMSGNYLGAIASVSGLFGGGGGPDPMQEQFARVFKQLAQMDKKLDEIIDLQKETLRGIEHLSIQIADLKEHLNYRLDKVDFEIKRVNDSLAGLLWEKVASCSKAWQLRGVATNNLLFNDANKEFYSFNKLITFTSRAGSEVLDCQDKLSKIAVQVRTRSSKSFAGSPIAIDRVIEVGKNALSDSDLESESDAEKTRRLMSELADYKDRYLQTYNFLIDSMTINSGYNKRWQLLLNNKTYGAGANTFSLLSSPAANAEELKRRIDYIENNQHNLNSPCTEKDSFLGLRTKIYLCTDLRFYDPLTHSGEKNSNDADLLAGYLLSEPIIRDQVGALVNWSLLVAEPSDFATQTTKAKTIERVLQDIKNSQRIKGRESIEDALMINDISIAQQSMVYGDLTAWFIYRALWDEENRQFRGEPSQDNEKHLFSVAAKILKNDQNVWMQKNVLMLILQSLERNCKVGAEEAPCQNRRLLYRIAQNRFLPPIEENTGNSSLVSQDQIAAGTNLFKSIFRLPDDATFIVDSENVMKLVLAGWTLPMPDINTWETKSFVYPPLMNERIEDQMRMGKRLAGYLMFDGMSPEDKSMNVNLTVRGF